MCCVLPLLGWEAPTSAVLHAAAWTAPLLFAIAWTLASAFLDHADWTAPLLYDCSPSHEPSIKCAVRTYACYEPVNKWPGSNNCAKTSCTDLCIRTPATKFVSNPFRIHVDLSFMQLLSDSYLNSFWIRIEFHLTPWTWHLNSRRTNSQHEFSQDEFVPRERD